MAQFAYTARTVEDGRICQGECLAESESCVRSELKRMGYTVEAIRSKKAGSLFGGRKRVKLIDMVNLCRRFSVMYSAGLPLLDCLASLAQENESKNLSGALAAIHGRIEQGSSIAEAFSMYPKLFSPFFVNLLCAGETTGKFDYVLSQLAAYTEKEYDLKRKIRQTFAYPIAVVVMIFVVVAIIMIVVVPVFSQVYMEMDVPLPGPTVALISVSNNAIYIFPSIIAVGAAMWVIYKKIRTIPAVKNWLDRQKFSIPAVGGVFHKIALLKFIRTLGITLAAGIQLSQAITVAENVLDNFVVSQAAEMIQRSIKSGGTLTEAVRLHSFFPQAIVHAFSAGEEAGKVDQILERFAVGLEQDVDDGIKKIITKIEPAMIVILSLVVGFILLAIYLPIFDLSKVLRK